MNRLARERISRAGGTIAGERDLPIGSRDVGRMTDELRFARLDFVLNSLIGPSSYEFLAAWPYLRDIDGWPGQGRSGSSHEAAAHVAMRELARLLAYRPRDEDLPLSQLM